MPDIGKFEYASLYPATIAKGGTRFYGERQDHISAMLSHQDELPDSNKAQHARAIALMARGILAWADACGDSHHTTKDFMGSQVFLRVAWGIHELLNYETGGIDCGTVSKALISAVEAAGLEW